MSSPAILEQEAKSETQTDSMSESESGGSHSAGLVGDDAPSGDRGGHSYSCKYRHGRVLIHGRKNLKQSIHPYFIFLCMHLARLSKLFPSFE